jgi:membrane-associated phospholipid phosphatase
MHERESRNVFICFLSKYCFLCFLITAYAFPVVSSADEVLSTTTVTSQQGEPKQITLSEKNVEFHKGYFKVYVTDCKNLVTAPARWDSSDWLTAGIFTGIAAVLYNNDAKIQKWVLDHKTSTTDNIGDTVTSWGLTYTPILLGGMYLYGHFADDPKMRKTVLLTIESVVMTVVSVETLKYAVQRHRPYTGDGPHAWDGIGHGSNSRLSFPSGHAAADFAIATVIASEYDNYIVPPLVYTIASITGLTRIAKNDHWSSDVFAGAAIGYFTGKLLVTSHRNDKEDNLSFAPMINDGGFGMMLTRRF